MANCKYRVPRGNLQDVRRNLGDFLCDIDYRIQQVERFSAEYKFDNSLTTTPASGYLSWDNADQTLVTSLHINTTTQSAVDISLDLQTLEASDRIFIGDTTNGQQYTYRVTAPVAILGGVATVPVEYVDASSAVPPGDQDDLTLQIQASVSWDDIVDKPPPFTPTIFAGAGTTGYVPDPGAELGYTLYDDGTWKRVPVSPIGGLFLNLRFDSNTAATDPGSGHFKLNNPDGALATEMYASAITDPGNNAGFIWGSLLPGEYVGVWEQTGQSRDAFYFIITGPVVDNGSWYTVPVTRVTASAGVLDDNVRCSVFFIPSENEKIPVGGTPGQVLTKDTVTNWDCSWQDPQGDGYWTASGNDLYNTAGGNVGIGTSTVSRKFVVNTDSNTDGISFQRGGVERLLIHGFTSNDAIVDGIQKDLYLRATRHVMFQTGGLGTIMSIRDTGYVGIGTTAPEQPLHVQAAAGVGLIAQFAGGAATNAYISVRSDNTHKAGIRLADPENFAAVQISIDHTTDILTYNAPSHRFTGDVALANNLTYEQMSGDQGKFLEIGPGGLIVAGTPSGGSGYWAANGNNIYNTNTNIVGVGISNPPGTVGGIHILSTDSGPTVITSSSHPLVIERNTANCAIMLLSSPTGNCLIRFGVGDTQNGRLLYANADNSMQFFTSNAEQMRITAAGELLVGTTTATAKMNILSSGASPLHLEGDGSEILRVTSSGGNPYISFYPPGGFRQGFIQSNVAATMLRISGEAYHIGLETNSAERMRITATGQVCIGTTQAKALLNVGDGFSAWAAHSVYTDKTFVTIANSATWYRVCEFSYNYGATATIDIRCPGRHWGIRVILGLGTGGSMNVQAQSMGDYTYSMAAAEVRVSTNGVNTFTAIDVRFGDADATSRDMYTTITGLDLVDTYFRGWQAGVEAYSISRTINIDNGGNRSIFSIQDLHQSPDAFFQITHTGRVGIGTKTPTRFLEIHTKNAGGAIAVRGSFSNNQFLQQSNNGSYYCYQYANISDTANFGYIWKAQETTIGTLDNVGNFTATGNVTAYSDRRLKKNIEVIDNALDKVGHLTGYTFERIDIDQRQTGLIAQDVQAILPEAVMEARDTGILSLDYGAMVGLLVNAIKELHAEVDYLRSQIE